MYYLSVAEGAVNGIRHRPVVLKRFVDGAEEPPFYQKRAPENRPDWMRTVTLSFPSGRTAEEIVVDDPAGLLWIVNLGCIELHPHAVSATDLDRPDELRIDLDPVPGVTWESVRKVALESRALLEELGLRGWVKTSGSRGMHVYARIQPRWGFTDVRRAALAFSREIERRAPRLTTSKWWKEERHGVFLDYNQNAKDRTVASAYSVRPTVDARVSAPLRWDEIADCDPRDFTLKTMPGRFADVGDRHADIDLHPGSVEALLELSARQEKEGLGDAPWPPHYRKQAGEGPRVAPSKRRIPIHPLIELGRSRDKAAALAGVERWTLRHPEAAAHLQPADVLVDAMRGRFRTWTRVRINLQHVPEALRPAQEPLDPDDDVNDWNVSPRDQPRRRPSRARTKS
jgi:DNA ligase D-like protein (predicted polymerase)